MKFDLHRTAFSRYGSYLSFKQDDPGSQTITVRNLHGSFGDAGKAMKIDFLTSGGPATMIFESTPWGVTAETTAGGWARIYIRTDDQFVVETRQLQVALTTTTGPFGYGYSESTTRFRILPAVDRDLLQIDVLEGRGHLQIRCRDHRRISQVRRAERNRFRRTHRGSSHDHPVRVT